MGGRTLRGSQVLCGLLAGILLVAGCAPGSNRTADKLQKDARDAQSFDPSLTFNDLTLEQANEQGKLLWKVKAKQAIYSRDKKVAAVIAPQGEFYQDGKAVFKISGDRSDVIEDGKSIILKGKITAVNLKDGVEIKGNELEWRPSEDVLLVRNKFTGTHKQLNIAANEGKFYSRSRKAQMNGQIVADVKNPKLQLRSEQLTWLLAEEKVTADRPVQIDRYRSNNQIDRATADKAEYDLKTKIASLQQNSQVVMAQPVLQAKSNVLIWNTDLQTITAPQPLNVVNATDQVTISADRGEVQLQEKMAYLNGNVRGFSQKNQANVGADRLTWNLDTQEFEADGNVTYQQANPVFNLVGSQARGRLQDQQVVVTGGPASSDNRVVTEIIPSTFKQN
ncbi:MAG: hypothetical protein B0A82_12660 [Alkalinema sp. CACIAM 70d]|nr:MAG: hypothetical protein B0A82_12660 [Alkalinema sp. CACIAM 70d]